MDGRGREERGEEGGREDEEKVEEGGGMPVYKYTNMYVLSRKEVGHEAPAWKKSRPKRTERGGTGRESSGWQVGMEGESVPQAAACSKCTGCMWE